MASNSDLFKQHIEALGKGDWNTYRSLLTDDVVYEEEATHRRVQTADDYVELVKAWKSAFPDFRGTIQQLVASGDAVVAEIEWQGTHKGALASPLGTIPPTGRAGKLPAVVVVRFDNGRIRSNHHYFDLMTLLAQVGALPKGAPQPGAA